MGFHQTHPQFYHLRQPLLTDGPASSLQHVDGMTENDKVPFVRPCRSARLRSCWGDRIARRNLDPAGNSRTVIALHYDQGLTLQETAAVLGLAPGTVKSRLAYGLHQLRQVLSASGVNVSESTKHTGVSHVHSNSGSNS